MATPVMSRRFRGRDCHSPAKEGALFSEFPRTWSQPESRFDKQRRINLWGKISPCPSGVREEMSPQVISATQKLPDATHKDRRHTGGHLALAVFWA